MRGSGAAAHPVDSRNQDGVVRGHCFSPPVSGWQSFEAIPAMMFHE
jgi:hypothetical protein